MHRTRPMLPAVGRAPWPDLWQNDALLFLVLALSVGVRDSASLACSKEKHLRDPFVSIDTRGKWGGVADLQGCKTFPFRLKGGDIDDDSAASVGALANANG